MERDASRCIKRKLTRVISMVCMSLSKSITPPPVRPCFAESAVSPTLLLSSSIRDPSLAPGACASVFDICVTMSAMVRTVSPVDSSVSSYFRFPSTLNDAMVNCSRSVYDARSRLLLPPIPRTALYARMRAAWPLTKDYEWWLKRVKVCCCCGLLLRGKGGIVIVLARACVT